ncbi:uncharacterized protein [Littorina saxatilis]|uniref:uncharacterized protein n=1 Tax=Littorina saxatilis TaxID=31220 RepID=UPI0038B44274
MALSSSQSTAELLSDNSEVSEEISLNQTNFALHNEGSDNPSATFNTTSQLKQTSSAQENKPLKDNASGVVLAAIHLICTEPVLPNRDTLSPSLAFTNPFLHGPTHEEPRPFNPNANDLGSGQPRPFNPPAYNLGSGQPRPFNPPAYNLGSGQPRPFNPPAYNLGSGQPRPFNPQPDASRHSTSAAQSSRSTEKGGRKWCLIFGVTLFIGCVLLGAIVAGVAISSRHDEGGDTTSSTESQDTSYTLEDFKGSFNTTWGALAPDNDGMSTFARYNAALFQRMIQDVYGLTSFNDRVKNTYVNANGFSKLPFSDVVSVSFALTVTQPQTQSSQPDIGLRKRRTTQLFHIKASDLRYTFLQNLQSYLNSARFSAAEKRLASRIDEDSVKMWQAVTTTTPSKSTTSSVSIRPRPSSTTKVTTRVPFTRGTTPLTTTMAPPEPPFESYQCGEVRTLPSGLRIVGGTEAEKGMYPWIVMLTKDGKFFCGGSILDPLHVITAAHCLKDEPKSYLTGMVNTERNSLQVIAGKDRSSLDSRPAHEQRVSVSSGYMHSGFTFSPIHNDIAVLRLSKPLVFNSRVSPICLPNVTDVMPRRCVVAGWGYTNEYFQTLPSSMRTVSLWTYNRTECQRTFPTFTFLGYSTSYYLKEGVFCAANSTFGGQDSCQGDSGGPLFCLMTSKEGEGQGEHYTQFGVVSWGDDCGKPGKPGFYTYLPTFRSWIYNTALPKLKGYSTTQTVDPKCRGFSPLSDYSLYTCRTVLNQLKNDARCQNLREAVDCAQKALAKSVYGINCRVEDVYRTIVGSSDMHITGQKLEHCEALKFSLTAGICKNLTAVSAAVNECNDSLNCVTTLEASLCVHRQLDPDWLHCSRQDIQNVILNNFNSSLNICLNNTARVTEDGRQFMFLNNDWLAVCADNWGHNEAKVTCNQRGFKNGSASLIPWSEEKMFVSGSKHAVGWMQITCSGAEASLDACQLDLHASCSESYFATAVCYNSNYAFELEPADPDGHYGYVRLSRDEGQGRVCVSDLTERNADVLCREAGYVAGMTFTRPLPPSAGGPVWSGDVDCGDRAVDINGCDRKVEWTFLQQTPDTCNPAAVFCFASKVRFHNGLLNNTGIVQMYRPTTDGHDVTLETVSRDAFTNTSAEVVCRQNGFPLGGHVVPFNPFHRSETEYVNLACPSQESSLDSCRVTDVGSTFYPAPAVVKCHVQHEDTEPELSVKLWSDHEVLVYTGGQWGTICADHWSNDEANAVCRQLGYLHGLRNTSAGGRVFPHVLHDMRCEVNVTSLQQCTSQAVRSDVCQNRRSAAVDCTNSSRPEYSLQGGSDPNEGQVYMHYNGTTAPMVGNMPISVASTLCQNLGYSTGIRNSSTYIHGNNQSYWMTSFTYDCPSGSNLYRCLQGEPSLIHCKDRSTHWRCSSSIPSVYCYTSAARVRTGTRATTGIVQLYRNGQWWEVCHGDVTQSAADVICRDIMGSSTAAAIRQSAYAAESDTVVRAHANCNRQNTDATSYCISVDVTSRCPSLDRRPAAVVCYDGQKPNGNITDWKKVFWSYPKYRVMVKRYGVWGTVCSDTWGFAEAKLFCKHLGYSSGYFYSGPPRASYVPMWALSVNCTYNDLTIGDCDVKLTDVINGTETCSSTRDAVVRCY